MPTLSYKTLCYCRESALHPGHDTSPNWNPDIITIIIIFYTPGSIDPRGLKSRSLLLLLLLLLNLGRSSRGGRRKLILEIIALMVNHPSGSHQQSSRAAG